MQLPNRKGLRVVEGQNIYPPYLNRNQGPRNKKPFLEFVDELNNTKRVELISLELAQEINGGNRIGEPNDGLDFLADAKFLIYIGPRNADSKEEQDEVVHFVDVIIRKTLPMNQFDELEFKEVTFCEFEITQCGCYRLVTRPNKTSSRVIAALLKDLSNLGNRDIKVKDKIGIGTVEIIEESRIRIKMPKEGKKGLKAFNL